MCGQGNVRYVSYVYGEKLGQANGRCISYEGELEKLGTQHDEFARYVVEVCLDCRLEPPVAPRAARTPPRLGGGNAGRAPRRPSLARRRASPTLRRPRGDVTRVPPVCGGRLVRGTLRLPPGAVCALDGGGTEMAGSRPASAPDVAARKGSGTPLVMVTAYDAPSARVVDEAGVDLILVGDTLAMVVLGYDDTLHVTIDDMVHHISAVARTKPEALVVGDLPWMSYHVVARGDRPQRRRAHPRRRRCGQARRRSQAARLGRAPSSTPRSR